MCANIKFKFCANIIKEKETLLLFRICCRCKYGVKAIFTIFALLVIVVQTQSLTCAQIRSKQSKYGICDIFATHVNPLIRAANLAIYLTFTATEKLSQMCYFFFICHGM